jgi:glyoxylase-like metal-dependent hydrolase (beta-lactamase superfamily II)
MPEADDLQQLTSSIWIWQAFDPTVKADLFSTALLSRGQLFLVDPIDLASPAREALERFRPLAGILLTNVNHLRDMQAWARREQAPVWASGSAGSKLDGLISILPAGKKITSQLTAITIDGAAPGETAFYFADDGGTVVIGDALINVEPYGFVLLPEKYCSDQKEMRRSLRQLLDYSFKRLLFAHGYPLVSSARERLEDILR